MYPLFFGKKTSLKDHNKNKKINLFYYKLKWEFQLKKFLKKLQLNVQIIKEFKSH